MFVDYLTLVILDVVAGLILTAVFVLFYLQGDRKRAAPGFLITGFVALMTGLDLVLTWPLPGAYNIPFGEMTLLFGILYFITGIAVLRDWDLLTVVIYAVFAGSASIVVGIRIYTLGLTSEPLVSMAGFGLAGLAGVLSLPVYWLRKHEVIRILAALLLVGGAVVWAIVGYSAYWQHLSAFGKWVPEVMRIPVPPAK